MGSYNNGEREALISWCAELGGDPIFDVTSDNTPLYNCIGYAMGMNDVFVALGHPDGLHWCWWPPTATHSVAPTSLIEAFQYFGFSKCENGNFEQDVDKVALYMKNNEWRHAAKIDGPGVYHSKMGCAWDIIHREGDLFKNVDYGEVYAFMSRPIVNRILTAQRKPKTGLMRALGHVYAVMNHNGKNYGYVKIR